MPFARDFFHHSRLMGAKGSIAENLASYKYSLTFGFQWLKLPLMSAVLLLPIVTFFMDANVPAIKWCLYVGLLTGTCVLVIAAGCSSYRLSVLELSSILAIGLMVPSGGLRMTGTAIQVLVALTILMANCMVPLEIFTRNRPDGTEVSRILGDLRASPSTKVFGDDYALWWLFDWNPPANFSSHRFSYHHDEKMLRTTLEEGEIWIAPQSEIQPEPLELFGRTFRSVPVNRNVFVILNASSDEELTVSGVRFPWDLHHAR